MDVTKILEHDHREAEALFAEIEKAEGADRQRAIDALDAALRAHMELEERVLYPMMAPVTGDEEVQEGTTEHALARDGLTAMVDLAPDEPGFGAALEAVKAGIHHHVDEEEHDVFPKLRKDGAKALDEMATPFMQTRVELGLPVDADALCAASTKDELVAEAEAAGIGGAGSMTKDELARELAAAMS